MQLKASTSVLMMIITRHHTLFLQSCQLLQQTALLLGVVQLFSSTSHNIATTTSKFSRCLLIVSLSLVFNSTTLWQFSSFICPLAVFQFYLPSGCYPSLRSLVENRAQLHCTQSHIHGTGAALSHIRACGPLLCCSEYPLSGELATSL